MKFWDMSKEEREDWRRHDATKAFIAEMAEHSSQFADSALSYLLDEQSTAAFIAAGRKSGIDQALDIAENEK